MIEYRETLPQKYDPIEITVREYMLLPEHVRKKMRGYFSSATVNWSRREIEINTETQTTTRTNTIFTGVAPTKAVNSRHKTENK